MVGYMTPENDVAGGNKMIGAMFTDVGTQTEGSGSYSVQNIIPTGASVPNGETVSTATCIYLQKLTASGATDGAVLFWRDGTFKQGKKTVEYRDFTDYWIGRLLDHPLKTARINLGYTDEHMIFEIDWIGCIDGDREIRAFDEKGEMSEEGKSEDFNPDTISIHLGKRIK